MQGPAFNAVECRTSEKLWRRSDGDRGIDRAGKDQEARKIGQSTKLDTSGFYPTRKEQPRQAA